MKRYFMRALNLVVQAVADKDGPWVRFEDAEAAEAKLEAAEKHNEILAAANAEYMGKLEALQRGEYICKQCGLRKDAEFIQQGYF